ncbi:MAG: glycosyltransferase family 39 protein [Bacteroidetes bacterium]|nr:glycosyltransferase family 39 protein [Bacteroidota bacterium]
MKKEHKNKKSNSPVSTSSQSKKKAETSSSLSAFAGSNNFYFIAIAILVAAVSIIRWRFVEMPLERDEGEYAYFAHLILKGITPYKEAYNMKLPGIYYMYALIMFIFGQSFKGIHIGFLIMNAGTMILLFSALKRFFNPMVGVIAAGIYGLMAMGMPMLGFAAHATHFAVFYVALSLFFFSKYEENKKIVFALLTGGMFGMAFLMKQQAIYFILFGGIVFLIFQFLDKPVRIVKVLVNTLTFSLGVFIPYLLVVLLMVATGTFEKFWFWTVQYASKYASGVPWSQGKDLLSMMFTPIWAEFKWIWLLAIAGAVVVLLTKFSVKQKVFALCFALFAALATTPGFYFRQHYFIVLLPAAALLAAITLDYSGRFLAQQLRIKIIGPALPLVILFLIFYSTVTSEPSGASFGKFYYNPVITPKELCKAIYGTNPFTESVEIAKYIKANSSDTDKIAVLGSEPQIPFYADRKSATGHIYTYGLMEIHDYNLKMQEEMISEIEKNKPLFLVFCNIPFSWLSKPNSPKRIFDWYGKYSQENYNVVGLVDIPDQGPSSFYWGADAQRNPKNKNSVWVFQRKAGIVPNP